jgi:CBS domain-containing protein
MAALSPAAAQARDFDSGDHHVVEIAPDTLISEAVNTLADHDITSAPVYDPKLQRYIGFFDVSDALAVLFGIDMMKNQHGAHKLGEQHLNVHGINIDLSTSEDLSGMDLPVSVMLRISSEKGGASHNAPWKPVYPEAELLEILKILAEPVRALIG